MMMSFSTLHLVALLAALAGIEAAKYGKPTLSAGPGVEGSTNILVYIRINSKVGFNCKKNGKETPKEHQWLKDGVLFNTTADTSFRKTFTWSDNGTYTCKLIAPNEADNNDPSSPVVIKTGGPPLGSEVRMLSGRSLTSNGAIFAWKKPASPPESFTSYKAVLKQETEGAEVTVPSWYEENPMGVLTSLEPFTFYTVTVFTVTDFGSVKIEGLPKTRSFVTRPLAPTSPLVPSLATIHVPVAMNIYIASASMVALFASVAVSGIQM